MFKVIVFDSVRQQFLLKTVNTVPSVGVGVDLGYTPFPNVGNIIMWPSKDIYEDIYDGDDFIEALIQVK